MKIIAQQGTIDTGTDGIVMVFNNDDEFNSFMTILATTPVRTSGLRILPLVPDNIELSPFQNSILEVLKGLDGIGGANHQKIADESIDSLKKIINE